MRFYSNSFAPIPLGHAHFHDGRFDLYAWNDMADELYEFSKHGLVRICSRS